MTKPRLFIGSSVETLPVAQALQHELRYDADITIWTQGIFGISNYTLEDLLAATREFDFAAFVFGADDIVEFRGERVLTARDNVVFELGLFVGHLGRQRAFIVLQDIDEQVHLPSDLNGITPAKFPWEYGKKYNPKQLASAIGAPAHQIRTAMSGRRFGSASIKPLSGGMIFVALCLAERSYTVNELGDPFRRFQRASRRISEGDAEDVFSTKAVQYACQCLEAVGWVESFGSAEYALTEIGRELLQSDAVKRRHSPTYDAFKKVMKKRTRRPSTSA